MPWYAQGQVTLHPENGDTQKNVGISTLDVEMSQKLGKQFAQNTFCYEDQPTPW